MTSNILLINPPVYDFAAYDLFAKPLGLLALASKLRQVGYHISLVDALDRAKMVDQAKFGKLMAKTNGTGKYYAQEVPKPPCLAHVPRIYRRYGLPAEQLAQTIAEQVAQNPPLAILVTSVMTYWYPGVREIIQLIRQVSPGTPIALGGIYASLMPDHAQTVCKPDRVFASADFQPLRKWLSDLQAAGSLPKTDNQYKFAPDEFPTLAYDLYDKLDYLTILASLGCPFRCEYCAGKALQQNFIQCPPEQFIDQLKNHLCRVQIHGGHYNIAFMDDALLVRAEQHLIPILQQVARLNQPLSFHCPNGIHARYITNHLAQTLKQSNFQMLRLSYEGAGSASLAQQASDAKIDDHTFAQAVKVLIDAGFPHEKLEAYILTGLPDQTIDEIRTSALAVHNLGLKAKICQYTPIPKTKLFAKACHQYNIPPDEPLLHNNSILPILAGQYGYAAFQNFKDWVSSLNNKL